MRKLPRQFWSLYPFTRSSSPSSSIRKNYLLYSKGRVAIDVSSNSEKIAWRDDAFVIGKFYRDLGLPNAEENDSNPNPDRVLVELGKVSEDDDSAFQMAMDMSAMEDQDELIGSWSRSEGDIQTRFVSPRECMVKGTSLDHEAMSVMGRICAKMRWHKEYSHSPRSGRKLVPCDGGHYRMDPEESDERLKVTYPRTDPVAIVLVQNSNGDRCLLGKTQRRKNSNMYSCLAGFVEQAESVEVILLILTHAHALQIDSHARSCTSNRFSYTVDYFQSIPCASNSIYTLTRYMQDAVRREVMEESGVLIESHDDVRLVGSQPWPIGAAGHSELMLGCIATASGDTIKMDKDEMDDLRWFSRDEARVLLERSKGEPSAVYGDAKKPTVVPPPSAIAHHLIQLWVSEESA